MVNLFLKFEATYVILSRVIVVILFKQGKIKNTIKCKKHPREKIPAFPIM
jgi:hypothetical protein